MKVSKELFDKMKELRTAYIGDDGREVNNPRPMTIPAGFNRPPTLQEQIQRCMKVELSKQAMQQGYESWEEANDFDIEEDFENDPIDSQYVVHEMIPEIPAQLSPDPDQNPGEVAPRPEASPATPATGSDQTTPSAPSGAPDEVR